MLLRFLHEIPVCRASESFRSDRYVHASGEYNLLHLPMQPGFPGSRTDLAPAPYRSLPECSFLQASTRWQLPVTSWSAPIKVSFIHVSPFYFHSTTFSGILHHFFSQAHHNFFLKSGYVGLGNPQQICHLFLRLFLPVHSSDTKAHLYDGTFSC